MEVESVGAGLGGGFTNATELKVMKYQEAVDGPDEESWKEEIIDEHDRMLKNNVFSRPLTKTASHLRPRLYIVRGRVSSRVMGPSVVD